MQITIRPGFACVGNFSIVLIMLIAKNIARFGAIFGTSYYVYDTVFQYERINRGIRAFAAAGLTVIDYKAKLDDLYTTEDLHKMHSRVAQRLLDVCKANAGLYVKFGQGIASFNHILPPEYRSALSELHDNAPAVQYEEIVPIFMEQFGKAPDDVFDDFDRVPVASASIAQVHKARLKDGTLVAVKVQKPYIRSQINWDLNCYGILVWMFEKIFDLPVYWTVNYTKENIAREADFRCEGSNMERARAHLEGTGRVDVCIPRVYWRYTGERILTQEWIDGVKITDVDRMKENNFDPAQAMDTITNFFASQLFQSGFLHCDPHPGNILIRRNPDSSMYKNNTVQVVVLDHGMYIEQSEQFRTDYAKLWKALVLMDSSTIHSICQSWGINDPNFFASLQLMKPYRPDTGVTHLQVTSHKHIYEQHAEAKRKIQTLLNDSSTIPPELIFVGRHLNIIRALNKELGSPVNRVEILANHAAMAVSEMNIETFSYLTDSLFNKWIEYMIFRSRLAIIGLFYHSCTLWRTVQIKVFGNEDDGFEGVLETMMQQSIEHQLGFKLDIEDDGKAFG